MRLTMICLMAGLLAVSACKPAPNAIKNPVKPSSASPAPAGKASPGSSILPGPVGSTRPTEAMAELKGLIQVDAHYAVSAGGANVVAAGSANVVAAGAGNVVAAGSANVVAAGSANVVAAGSANVVAAGSANVIAAGSANYRLLGFDVAAAPPVAVGTVLPAWGMGVIPLSLLTGEPIGEVVYTNEQGRYTVAVPERLKGEVLLFASMPGKSKDDALLKDRRLHYPFLPTTAAADAAQIDEESALLTWYLRKAVAGALENMIRLAKPDYEPGAEFASWLGSAGGSFLKPFLAELVKELSAIESSKFPYEARQRLAERLGDIMAAEVDWRAAQVDKSIAEWQPTTDEAASTAFLDLLVRARRAATQKMIQDPTFFDRQPWIAYANAGDAQEGVPPADPPFKIVRPSDINDFLMRAYIAPNRAGLADKVRTVYTAIGVDPKQADRLRATQYGVLNQLGLTLITKPTVKTRVVEAIRTFKP